MRDALSRAARRPINVADLDWIPLSEGFSFKPLNYFPGLTGYQALLRLEPGTVIPKHRHTGEIHAFNLSGTRVLLDTDEIIGPGVYVYEPPGNVDSWKAIGDEPCVIHVEFNGSVEYLADDGTVIKSADASSNWRVYRDWCAANGRTTDPSLGPGGEPSDNA